MRKVSVICPTYDREERHQRLYEAFAHQTYENKELLVLDDSPRPSDFLARLSVRGIRYFYSSLRMSIGAKRNELISRASGELIAHFDDDDYYAPDYLSSMVAALDSSQAEFIKQSRWWAWRESDGSLWEWDTRSAAENHYVVSARGVTFDQYKFSTESAKEAFRDSTLWGFGFSYVYLRQLWQQCRFEDVNFGEDYRFVCAVRASHHLLAHTADLPHLTLHTLHSQSSSKIFPQRRLNPVEVLSRLGRAVGPWLVIDRPH